MIIPETPDTPPAEAKNGVVGDYFYLDDVKQTAYKLIKYEGSYYYITDGHKVAKNTTIYLNKVLAGTGFEPGKYTFDAEGKMIIPETPDTPPAEAKNGVVGDYFYLNDVKQTAYQLIQYEGYYYYVSDGHKVVKNATVYMNKVLAGTGLAAGRYTFDAEGRMILD
jgi:glucan-binding YG repeat protein